MLSKERVLEALRVHLDASADCEDCPYHDNDSGCNSIDMFAEVQELMKEHEPIRPYVAGDGKNFENASTWWYACGNCNKSIDPGDKYCRHCGRKLKWE